ncbi:AMP-binding protein [Sporichthya polymorpha]|uniref:AMP-binding protein n=1 Tax=Sporichthya polymorpha TaxID=35751 RepID=UPI000363E42B|nr:AMP-binding protein [Sporichthya polymorpha]
MSPASSPARPALSLRQLLPGLVQGAGRGDDRPDALAVDGVTCSRADLLAAALSLAGRLTGARTVVVEATPTLETVIAVVGALAAGVAVVPLAPDAGPLERGHVLRDSGADVVLGDPAWAGEAGSPLERVPVPAPGTDEACRLDADTRAGSFVLYTSGTTGPPKGVVLSAGAVAADLDALAAAWAWTADDVLVHGLPLFHVHGLVLGVLGSLRTGNALVHTGRPLPERYAAAGGSLYFGVPTVWSRMVAEPATAAALRPARLLVSGSAGLPAPVFDALSGLTGHQPVERYGMTETLITIGARADGERRPGQVGLPLPGVRTRILGEDGAPVPHDGETVGDLQVQAPTMFDGYLNRPEATAACWTSDGWFVTGDVATIGPDGWHRIVGRASVDLIKSGGYRIGAGEVEAALLAHPGVREAAVVGEPDPDLGQRIVAFVVADEGTDAAVLTQFVADGLSVHKRPRRVELVENLPRNALGKVQKSLLIPGT